MLSPDHLKRLLQQADLTRADKVLLVVSTFEQPAKLRDIKAKAQQAGCRMSNWNITEILTRAKGTTIRVPDGYEVAEKGHARLHELGAGKFPPAAAKVAHDLRKHLVNIKDATTRAFVEEAIQCYETGLHRSAIVMSWLAAVGVLQEEVVANHLAPFNLETKRIDAKWKDAKTTDDIGRMKESDFLDRLVAISVVGKNVKAELKKALDLRNGCGHPNSLRVGTNVVAGHIEVLLLNVFEPFSA